MSPGTKPAVSLLGLLAALTMACGDSFSPSGVAGVYEWVDAPAILSETVALTTHNGQPALEEISLWVDWEHYTLDASGTWTWEASTTTVVKVFLMSGMLVDSFDIPVSPPVISGSFILSPPDSIFFSDGSQTFGGTIVPPNLVVGKTYTRR